MPQTGPYFTHDARVAFYRARARPRRGAAGRRGGRRRHQPAARRIARARVVHHRGPAAETASTPTAQASLVTPGLLRRARHRRSSRGRLFDEHDDAHAPLAVVVSESFARRFFPDEDADRQAHRAGPARADRLGRRAQPPPQLADDRRRRARREEPIALEVDAGADALSVGAAALEPEPDARRADAGRSGAAGRVDPARGARGRSERAGVQRADDGRGGGGGAGASGGSRCCCWRCSRRRRCCCRRSASTA